MTSYRTVFVAAACGILLWILISQANHYLSPSHLYLFTGGLLVALPALRLGRSEGWRAVMLIGLWIDASTPVAFGLHGLLFLFTHSVVSFVRGRFPKDDTVIGIILALVANAALFIAISVPQFLVSFDRQALIARLFFDLFLSELIILLIAPWYFALQERALEIAGVSLRRERRGLL